MEKLLKNANLLRCDISKITKDVVGRCSTCIKFKRPSPRPIVGLPKAESFNETVSVDLHQLEPKLWYMHAIDELSRYSSAGLISSKKDAAKAFLLHWTAIFGAPENVFYDNGGEFIGEDFMEMSEKFNI